MNLFRKLFSSEPPPPPPEPAEPSRLQAVRGEVVAVFTAIRQRHLAQQRRERERRRQEEEERRRREAEAPPSPVSEENVPRYSIGSSIRFQRPDEEGFHGVHFSRTLEPDVIRSAFEHFDPRAFARRIVRGVKEVYGGNPVPFYTAAGLSRSAYSKLISHPDRHPSKDTVLAMAAALKMDADAATDFLRLAGYALSDSIPADIIWRACFSNDVHHLPQIRSLLAEFAPHN